MIIYKATNTINGKVYIGQTIQKFRTRQLQHRNDKRNKSLITKAINKYGFNNFNWNVIDTATSLEELNEKEMYWIEKYNSIKNGYNQTTGGKNFKMSDETKLKMSGPKKDTTNYKGYTNPNNLPAWNKGKTGVYKKSDEAKKKLSESLKGHKGCVGKEPWNKGLKGAQVAWNKGRECSDDEKKKISETLKGRVPWNKGLKGVQVAWNKGIPCSDESKLKQIETKKNKKL